MPFATTEPLAEPHKPLDRIANPPVGISSAIGLPGIQKTLQSIPSHILPM